MQAMPWDAVLEMVNALDFDTIAEPEDDYILLNLAGAVEVGSNGINPASGKIRNFMPSKWDHGECRPADDTWKTICTGADRSHE